MSAKPVRWMMTGAGKPMVAMEFEIGKLGPDEVLVEIAGCGVCHTDLGYYYDGVRTKHALPLTLGHEISGRVIDAGADVLRYIDRAVIIPAVIPCGRCDACLRGAGGYPFDYKRYRSLNACLGVYTRSVRCWFDLGRADDQERFRTLLATVRKWNTDLPVDCARD